MIIKKNRKKSAEEGVELQVPTQNQEVVEPEQEEQDIDIFNLDNIDFKQRQERRRGDRRRGFRRIDDRNLISRAREEADSIREAAAKEGYQEGIDKAKNDILEVKESMDEFFRAKQEVFESIAPDILEISLDIAKKIIKKEMTENPEILLDNIKDILKSLSKEETKIVLKVNPSQVQILKQELPEAVMMAGLEAKVIVVPDDDTMEGGCLITTDNGVIDATIETQLAIISEVLKEI
ncbi:hypothetical protein HDR58_07455 [bacterium]|nr:hypothetical protein [bacterium]